MARITLPESGIETLFGSYDENLKHLESQFGVRLRTQGHDVIVDGAPSDVGKVERLFSQLGALFQEGYRVSNGDVKTAAQLIASDPNIDLREYFLKSTQTQSGKRRVVPKTVNQRRYLDAIEQNDIVFGIGPAGTGKTYLAMAQAVSFLLSKRVNRIILARPAVEAGEKLGFLPGDLQEKVNPYLRPLYDALYDMVEVERAERLIERGTIEIAPIAFMRGRTLNDAFVILDEAQNTTSEQMKMFLTRLGFGSKAVVTGRHHADRPADGAHLWTGRSDESRVEHRRDLIHPFRRSRRRTPQTGAADRQGLRGVYRQGRAGLSLQVSVVQGGTTHPSARGLGRWLARIAPRSARGIVTIAILPDRQVKALNRKYRRKNSGTDVLSFPGTGEYLGRYRHFARNCPKTGQNARTFACDRV